MASDAPASATTNSTTPNSVGAATGLQRPALSNVSDISAFVARSGLQTKLSTMPPTTQAATQLLAETQSLAKKMISQLTQTAMSKLSQASITSVSTATTSTVSSDQPAAISLTTPPATTMQSLLASASGAKTAVNGAAEKGSDKKRADKKEAEKEESSESSSENSSSETSSSSEGESDGAEKKIETDKPGPKSLRRKRGRPRKYIAASTPTMKSPNISLSKVKPLISSNTRSASRSKKRHSKVPERLTMSLESQRVRKRIIISDPVASPLSSRKRGRGCGDCPGCLRDDCGKCTYCKDKPKFGGPGRKKQRCALRVCSNFVRSAVPGVRNPKHSLEQAAAASVAAEATAVEKRKALAKQKIKEAATPTPSKDTPTPAKEPAVPVGTATPVALPSATTAKKSEMMHCIQCDRERKLSMARSEIFCTQRCMMQWVTHHPEKKTDSTAATSSKAPAHTPSQEKSKISASAATEVSPSDEAKRASRELKNLKIDMALPGTTLHDAPSSDGAAAPLSPPTQTLAPSPRPLSSAPLITTKRPASTGGRSPATKKLKETATEPAATGTKRTSSSQPSAVKKSKQDATVIATPITTVATSASKSVTFDLTTMAIPVTTVQPISAPPLSRTIQPPSISIVPLDQLSELSATLLGQSKLKSKKLSAIPQGLPTDIRSWTIEQVVKYFQFTPECRDYADIFHEQEVDGTALLLLTHESLVKCLGIKLGRALKIMMHVEELRKRFDQNQ